MIISLEWLRQFVDIEETPNELAELLSKTGLEAEVIGMPSDLSGIVIGYVETVQKHPDADKLKLCTVNDGESIHQVVCGAPNVDAGQHIAFAKVGAVLPGNFKIKSAKIRGVESFGMICSERELQISDEHEGIMVLPSDLNPGDDFIESYGKNFLSVELDITPNRPDAFSHQGVARDIATAMNRTFNPIVASTIQPTDTHDLPISMENPDDCPRYIGGIVKNVKIGPSPDWLVTRLKSAGQRSINNLVDISNFVLLEMGHPTHIFDYDKLENKSIHVRRAKEGEELTTLDEVNHKLDNTHLLITDGPNPIALAGVMGGANSAVSDSTTTVLVESAYFDPVTIRKSAKSLQMSTDASKRFERGADPDGATTGFWRVIQLLCDIAGGELSSDMIDEYPKPVEISSIPLRRSELDLVLGYVVSSNEVERILKSLGFNVSDSNGDWDCIPPTFRPDVEREIDLIEEIARMVGYDAIPSDENIYGTFRYAEPDPESKLDHIRMTLQGFGFNQIYSNSLQNEIDANSIGKTAVKMMNPLSSEMAYLRTSLLPGLMKAADFNVKNGTKNFRLFELANVHEQKEKGFTGILETQHLAGIIYGESNSESVHTQVTNEDLFSLKGYLTGLFKKKFNMNFSLSNTSHNGYEYCQSIQINRQSVGQMGRLSPAWISSMDLDLNNIFAFEVNLSPIIKMMRTKNSYKPVNSFPKIQRDLNLVMDASQPVGHITDMMLKKGKQIITQAEPVNIYEDSKALGSGLKSITFNLEFQGDTKTLEDKDVTPVINEIIRVAESEFNAKLRS